METILYRRCAPTLAGTEEIRQNKRVVSAGSLIDGRTLVPEYDPNRQRTRFLANKVDFHRCMAQDSSL